jgi:HTH-type transcriptional regulator/antitoxin HipB
MKEGNDLITLDELINREYGKKGTPKREKFEHGYNGFRVSKNLPAIPPAKKKHQ